ncbi:hypothetical protein [Agromyces marinus]|uniref:Uncharacterized protein n=1 Tax=Agromyces marinus TaxID=1389020 RepID=A0ABM8H5H5_9MICO|nr:hypothetical protein [Agromyces marinus]UIP58977.1 hypothetical protein DSM26151_18680 [Agromyces marinus]BDZ56053.1 hypothetical protein GCM10025870_31260 [Agromyces marinus]
MNTATALARITAAASAVVLGAALAGCQGTRSDDSGGSAKPPASAVVPDDLSPLRSRPLVEPFRLPEPEADDLSPLAGC